MNWSPQTNDGAGAEFWIHAISPMHSPRQVSLEMRIGLRSAFETMLAGVCGSLKECRSPGDQFIIWNMAGGIDQLL